MQDDLARKLDDQATLADQLLIRLMGELSVLPQSVALLDDSALGELARCIGRAAEEIETLRSLRGKALEG